MKTGCCWFALDSAVEMNHERHERHENKGPKHGWPTPNYRAGLMINPNSTGRSPFVLFVLFVVPTAFFRFTHCRSGGFAAVLFPSVSIRVHPWFKSFF